MKEATFELLSQTLGCLGLLRHQPSQAALASIQLLSPLPWQAPTHPPPSGVNSSPKGHNFINSSL